MHLQNLPRGSLPARLAVIDLVSRLEASTQKTTELRHAVAVVSQYLMDADAWVSESTLEAQVSLLERLY